MIKIFTWIMANAATLLGCLQAIVKAVKELLTGVVNLLSLFMSQDVAEKAVAMVRNAMNFVDDFIEKIKGYLIK
jgi:fumarate reductase subunit D